MSDLSSLREQLVHEFAKATTRSQHVHLAAKIKAMLGRRLDPFTRMRLGRLRNSAMACARKLPATNPGNPLSQDETAEVSKLAKEALRDTWKAARAGDTGKREFSRGKHHGYWDVKEEFGAQPADNPPTRNTPKGKLRLIAHVTQLHEALEREITRDLSKLGRDKLDMMRHELEARLLNVPGGEEMLARIEAQRSGAHVEQNPVSTTDWEKLKPGDTLIGRTPYGSKIRGKVSSIGPGGALIFTRGQLEAVRRQDADKVVALRRNPLTVEIAWDYDVPHGGRGDEGHWLVLGEDGKILLDGFKTKQSAEKWAGSKGYTILGRKLSSNPLHRWEAKLVRSSALGRERAARKYLKAGRPSHAAWLAGIAEGQNDVIAGHAESRRDKAKATLAGDRLYDLAGRAMKGLQNNPLLLSINPQGIPAAIRQHPEFAAAVAKYEEFHGTKPTSIRRVLLPLGGKKVTGTTVLWSLGRAPDRTYTVGKGSRKAAEGPHYKHDYETQPEVVSDASGRLVMDIPRSPKTKIAGGWMRG